MKKHLIILASIAIPLTGCATSSNTYAPDGREAITLNCSGGFRNWGHCYKSAGDKCGAKGYDIIEKSNETGVMGSNAFSHASVSSVYFRTMTVSCRQ